MLINSPSSLESYTESRVLKLKTARANEGFPSPGMELPVTRDHANGTLRSFPSHNHLLLATTE